MNAVTGVVGRRTNGMELRRRVRRAAAALSAAIALVYVLIGFGVLRVVEAKPGAEDLLGFGLASGAAFALGAALLLRFDDRRLWVLGAIFQVLVLVMYVAVAPERTPPFEVWGVSLKVMQAVLLAALVYLTLRAPGKRAAAKGAS